MSVIKESIVGSAENRAYDSLKAALAKHKARWRTVPDRLQKDETEIGGLVIRRHLMHTFGDTRDFIAKCDKWFEDSEDKHEELGIKLGSPPWIAYIKQLTAKDKQRWPGSPDEDAGPGSSGSANNELTAGGIAEPVLPIMEYN